MHYPLIRQFDLIRQSNTYTVENAWKARLPQLNVNAQVTYQSDVTSVPISIPNIDIPTPDKDQYNLYAEATQSINDLYTSKDRVALIEATHEVDMQKTEVELYRLRERINQLYFGILVFNAQLQQTELLQKDIRTGIDNATVAVENGIAIPSAVTLLEAESLQVDQRMVEIKAGRKAYLQMLSLFIGKDIDETTSFENPISPTRTAEISRPELKLYELQRQTYDLQSRLLTIDNLPRFSVFLRAGVGKPGLNMLNDEFDFYYLGGLRMNWNLSTRYTYQNQKQLLSLNQNGIDLQRETFYSNLCHPEQQDTEITKLRAVATDQAIILLLKDHHRHGHSTRKRPPRMTTSRTSCGRQGPAKPRVHEIQQQAQYNFLTTTVNNMKFNTPR
jgi:outer membrane protein TolC